MLRATSFEAAAGNPLFYVNSDDADTDGIPDWLEDDDTDNVPNFLDPDHGDFHDTDGDGLVDLYDTDNNGVASALPDGDNDGEYDFRDGDNRISLPVELLTYTAIKSSDFVQLDWATASEINNDYYTVERSVDGKIFETILTEQGQGNSLVRNDYRRYDEKPLDGNNYYRLSQTDFDGTRVELGVRVVYFESEESNVIVYPNPTDGQELFLQIDKPGAGRCKLQIINSSGKLVKEMDVTIYDELKRYKLEVLQGLELASGAYNLLLITEIEVKTVPFIKR